MNGRPWIHFICAAGIILAGAFLTGRIKAKQKLGEPGLRLDLPVHAVPFQSSPLEVTTEEIQALPKDTTFGRRLYWTIDGERTNHVMVNVVLMGSDRTSIHKPQFCLTGQGWQIQKTDRLGVPIPRPQPYDLPVMKLTATRMMGQTNGAPVELKGLYVYWFVADDALTADHWQRMWWMARELLWTGTLQRWAYVSLFTVCLPGEEKEAFDRVQLLMRQIVPDFQKVSGSARMFGG
ncbi:MAG TPA: exosortase-associated EpsI family protein [Candidatus Paceibacterota bacterium]|nr:exosortase-associated EpsI family protein [Verrucomicrobiota bacterium]HRY51348.1 exosortase-associated EpsI family protein [Candidatus Paceibacterota bacterium]HSA01225.1 exosortase-associated EpsI family protein [Candidatus Paceibacterota bacterium]